MQSPRRRRPSVASLAVDAAHLGFPHRSRPPRCRSDGVWSMRRERGLRGCSTRARSAGACVDAGWTRIYGPDPATPLVVEESCSERSSSAARAGTSQYGQPGGIGIGSRRSGARPLLQLRHALFPIAGVRGRIYHTWIFTATATATASQHGLAPSVLRSRGRPTAWRPPWTARSPLTAAPHLVQFDFPPVPPGGSGRRRRGAPARILAQRSARPA